jgi:formiminotetrahydrofolate cyclodeaminase
VIAALRKRLQELLVKDAGPLEALGRALALPAGPERAQAVSGARLMAYRSARRLLDYTVQGLTLMQSALDFGSTAFLTDIEAGNRLLMAAQETGIAASEDHLREMEPAFAAGERAALADQIRQARELATRAEGALSWRRGKV